MAPLTVSPVGSGSAGPLDPAQVRKRRTRAALAMGAGDAGQTLAIEVATRMLERLDYVKLEPAIVVDAGCGPGHALPGLAQRFPEARVVAVDTVLPLLLCAGGGTARTGLPDWIRRVFASARSARILPVVADPARLPLRDGAAGCVWSNLVVQGSNDPGAVFADWHRVLRTGGLAQFSLLGPDTLKELRAATRSAGRDRVHPFIDMHDIGDMLVHAGFADPVMDMEAITLTYRTLDDLFADLRASGATNALAARQRGLSGAQSWRKIRAAYEAMRRDDTLPATFEIIYGHAWKPPPRAGADGIAVVRVEDIGRAPRR